MKLFVTILSLLLNVSYTVVHSFPQSAVSDVLSVEEVINKADSSKYGQEPGRILRQATGEQQIDGIVSELLTEDNSFTDFIDEIEDISLNSEPKSSPSTSVQDIIDDIEQISLNCVSEDVIEDVFSVTQPRQTLTDDEFGDCTDYEKYGFYCVGYNQCKDGFILEDGAGLIDIRGAFLDPSNSKCPGDLEVCCREESFGDVPLPQFEPATTTPQPPICPSPRPVTPEPTIPGPSTPKPTKLQQCGQRNANGVGVRILNDNDKTQFGEWPHMCAVLKEQQLGGKEVNLYVCGGSLISPSTLLTAAHCVDDFVDQPEVVKVRCGEWDTQQDIEPEKHQDRNAFKISVHPLFKSTNLRNDFALIHLESDFELAPHINPICLPSQDSLDNLDFSPEGCVATGWGKDKYGREGNYQVIMKQVEMDLVEHSECEATLRETKLGRRYNLDDSFLCAGGEPEKDTCKGDGGGPLVCPRYSNTEQYVQTGIVAFGIGCGNEIPGVYANVSEALCFIDWATKCAEVDFDYFGYTGCVDWGKRQYCQLKDELATVSAQDNFTSRRKAKKLEESIESLENAIRNCDLGPYYLSEEEIDCNYFGDYESDEVDLSVFERQPEIGQPRASDESRK